MYRRELLAGMSATMLGEFGGCSYLAGNGSGGDWNRSLSTSDGFLLVNGTAFAPTGMYYWPDISASLGRSPLKDVARYGLNTVTARYNYIRLDDDRVEGQPTVHNLREAAEESGIYFLLESPPPGDLMGRSDSELQNIFHSLADQVARSPYFLGWTFDEPVWRGIDLPLIRRTTQIIRDHPLEQIIYFVYAPVDERWSDPDWPDMTAYSAEADIVGHTFYPIDPGLPWAGYIGRSRLVDYGWYTERVQDWVNSDTPIWVHQQSHRVGDLSDPPTDKGRRPTRRETRFMSFQALARGATGIFYFPGSKLGKAIPFDAPVWDEYITDTAADIQAIIDPLSAEKLDSSVSVSSPNIQTLHRRDESTTLLLAVRETGAPSERIQITLPREEDRTLEIKSEGRTIQLRDGTFSDVFGPYDVKIYRTP